MLNSLNVQLFLNFIRASQVALVVKNLPASAGDPGDGGSIPGSGRSPGGGHGNPLQYSCLLAHGQRRLVGYNPQSRKELDMTEATQHACKLYHNWISGKTKKCLCRFIFTFQRKCKLLVTLKANHIKIFNYQKSESESEVAQSCPTLCNPMDCSLPGSSIHGILQARILEWVAISFSKLSKNMDANSSELAFKSYQQQCLIPFIALVIVLLV